jgi:hypothetical protein
MSRTRTTDVVTYETAHYRARQDIPRVCFVNDDTCAGLLHAALRHDTPQARIHTDARGRRYSLDTADYIRMCASHHARYDHEHFGWYPGRKMEPHTPEQVTAMTEGATAAELAAELNRRLGALEAQLDARDVVDV